VRLLVMIVTVLIVIVTAATHFNAQRAFDFPPGALSLTPTFFAGLGAGLVIAIYDYLGYYTSAYLGDEVARPGYVIPRSIILAIPGLTGMNGGRLVLRHTSHSR
jgi:amino acid transporter